MNMPTLVKLLVNSSHSFRLKNLVPKMSKTRLPSWRSVVFLSGLFQRVDLKVFLRILPVRNPKIVAIQAILIPV